MPGHWNLRPLPSRKRSHEANDTKCAVLDNVRIKKSRFRKRRDRDEKDGEETPEEEDVKGNSTNRQKRSGARTKSAGGSGVSDNSDDESPCNRNERQRSMDEGKGTDNGDGGEKSDNEDVDKRRSDHCDSGSDNEHHSKRCGSGSVVNSSPLSLSPSSDNLNTNASQTKISKASAKAKTSKTTVKTKAKAKTSKTTVKTKAPDFLSSLYKELFGRGEQPVCTKQGSSVDQRVLVGPSGVLKAYPLDAFAQYEFNHIKRVADVPYVVRALRNKAIKRNDHTVLVLENMGSPFSASRPLSSMHQVLGYVKCILKALQILHSRRIFHGDVKTDNIMFKDGKAYLIDFEMARALEPGKMFTATMMGTDGYFSPDYKKVAENQLAIDPKQAAANDMWALGVTVAEWAGLPVARYDCSEELSEILCDFKSDGDVATCVEAVKECFKAHKLSWQPHDSPLLEDPKFLSLLKVLLHPSWQSRAAAHAKFQQLFEPASEANV